MISGDDIRGMDEFKPFYDQHVECDLCGQQTKGRVYTSAPDLVLCGSCHMPLIGNITKKHLAKLPFLSTKLHFFYKAE
jgi:hypothetical protein